MIKNTVGVLMVAYNVEKTIRQAIDSVLDQKLNAPFKIKLIIADDNSSDGTWDIVHTMKLVYPEIIAAYKNESNLGHIKNYLSLWQQCDCEYIAMLDSDDYWIDENKLQSQIDILKSDPKCSIVYTDAESLVESPIVYGKVDKTLCGNGRPPIIRTSDLVFHNPIPNLTVMYRNHNIVFPEPFKQLKYFDWGTHVLHSQFGYARFIPKVTGVYRVHKNGDSGGSYWNIDKYIESIKKTIETYDIFNLHFNYKYDTIISSKKKYLESIIGKYDELNSGEDTTSVL